MLNIIGSIVIASLAGGFYLEKDDKFLAALCIIAAFLFAIGYFDIDKKEHEKSVK